VSAPCARSKETEAGVCNPGNVTHPTQCASHSD
jgi:hypothetical protein